MGWGAHLRELHTQGTWSPHKASLHINVRELRSVRLSCAVFLPHIRGKSVLILLDNMTAVAYINKQGGTRSPRLCSEALHLWELCIGADIHPMASCLLGSKNVLADRLSRSFVSHKWSLHWDIA